MFSPP
jgi:adiponectin receptor